MYIVYIYIYRPIASDLLSEENNEYLPQSRGKKVITPPPPPNKKEPRRGVGNAMGSRG